MEQSQSQCAKRLPIVLIIDDNPSIRNVVSWSLRLGDYEPIEAANGLEAIQWIEQAACQQCYPSVILLDLAMPGMDGRSFMHWLQTTWPPYIPFPAIIVVTAGHVDARILHSSIKQIVTKPFHVRALLDIIRRYA